MTSHFKWAEVPTAPSKPVEMEVKILNSAIDCLLFHTNHEVCQAGITAIKTISAQLSPAPLHTLLRSAVASPASSSSTSTPTQVRRMSYSICILIHLFHHVCVHNAQVCQTGQLSSEPSCKQSSFKPLQVSEQEKCRQSACGDSQTTCERHGAHKRSRSPARSGSAQTRSQSPGGRRTKSSKVSKQTMSLLLEPGTCTKFASLIYVHKSNRDKIVYW